MDHIRFIADRAVALARLAAAVRTFDAASAAAPANPQFTWCPPGAAGGRLRAASKRASL